MIEGQTRAQELTSTRPTGHQPRGHDVEGVVLAGVHAWGECVLESVICRPLFPVAGWPLITHTLSWLRDSGLQKVSICANSDTAALRRCLGDGECVDLKLHYYEDKMPRGPAGCARDAVIANPPDVFVVVEGTVVPDVDMADLLAAHTASGAFLTVVVSDGDAVRRGCETRPERLEPLGIYVFSSEVLPFIPATGYQDIKESLIPRLYAQKSRVGSYVVRGPSSPRVTNAAAYIAVSKWAVERLSAREATPEGYVRLNGAIIHESARLHGHARFIGPVLIGPHCRIEEDALIVGPTSIGADCTIGRNAVVSRSVLWNQCRVGAGAVLDHSILTNSAQIADEAVVRETVCLARPPRRPFWERVRSFFRSERSTRRPVAYITADGPTLPLNGSKRGSAVPAARTEVVATNDNVSRTDAWKLAVSPATLHVATGTAASRRPD